MVPSKEEQRANIQLYRDPLYGASESERLHLRICEAMGKCDAKGLPAVTIDQAVAEVGALTAAAGKVDALKSENASLRAELDQRKSENSELRRELAEKRKTETQLSRAAQTVASARTEPERMTLERRRQLLGASSMGCDVLANEAIRH